MLLTFLWLCSISSVVISSKCPESTKPHNTNCSMFYTCVNLPNDGFIWIPSRCTDNLVFQPFLRICVSPGGTKSCNTSEIQHTNEKETYKLTNSSNFADLELTKNSSKDLQTMSLYNFSAKYQKPITSKPLTDIQELIATLKDENSKKNLKIPTAIDDKKIDYTYTYTNKQVPLPFEDTNKTRIHNNNTWLTELLNRLFIYRRVVHSLRQFESSTNPSKVIGLLESLKVPNDTSNRNILLNNLIRSYIRQYIRQNIFTKYKVGKHNEPSNIPKESNEPIFDRLLSNLKFLNCIAMISDALGNKQYFTIEKYKSVAHQIESQSVMFIPCMKDIRFLNETDCTKYYTCEPIKAQVVNYHCPLNTAFNDNTRACDIQTYKTCAGNRFVANNALIETPTTSNNSISDSTPKRKICEEVGKTRDPTSEMHYYICYSSSTTLDNIQSIRMTCPNDLIFCRSRKLCTIRKLCMT